MLFVLLCRDKTGALDIRMANRDAHLAYLKSSESVVMAGPLLSDAGDMIGSLLVIEAEDRAAAEAWADADPYNAAGLFDSVSIDAWKRAIG